MANTLGRPDDGEYQFWIEERVRNFDTDQFQHVNNAAIASYCEAGRMGLFAEPLLQEEMPSFDIVVVRLAIEFERELRYPGTVHVGTRVTAIGNSSFQVGQGLYESGSRFAKSEATCVMLGRSSRTPARIPSKIRQFLMPAKGTD